MSISDRMDEIQERADRATDAVTDIEQAIEQVAKRLHSSYCECEGWHTECQGPQVGDRRVARRLAAEGLIAPAPLTEETETDQIMQCGVPVAVIERRRRWVTDWYRVETVHCADGIDRSEGGKAATSD